MKSMQRTALAPLAAICMALLVGTTASAAEIEPVLTGEFECSEATPCGPYTSFKPQAVAVDQQSDDVYVIDKLNDVVLHFGADGTYKSHIAGSFDFDNPTAYDENDIAVDNSGGPNQGRLFVQSESTGVYAFDATGSEEWHVTPPYTCGIAADPDGNPWFGGYEIGIQKLDPATGATVGAPLALPGEDACRHDFTSTGDIALAHWLGAVDLYSPGGLLLGPIRPGVAAEVAVNRSDDTIYAGFSTELSIHDTAGTELSHPLGATQEVDGLAGFDVNGDDGKLYASEDLVISLEEVDLQRVVIYSFPVFHELSVAKEGSGMGTVTSFPPGIDCGEACSADLEKDTPVELTATPAAGSGFVGWSGACSGSEPVCEVTMSEAREVVAEFEVLPVHPLTVETAGDGSGTVSCDGEPCAAEYPQGSEVTLEAVPDAGSAFVGWSGDCQGSGDCPLTIEGPTEAAASFALESAGGGADEGSGGSDETGDGGGGELALPAPVPPPATYGSCLRRASAAYKKSLRQARRKRGKARTRVLTTLKRRHDAQVIRCKRRFDRFGVADCMKMTDAAYKKSLRQARRKRGKARARAVAAAKRKRGKQAVACKRRYGNRVDG